MRPPVSKYDLMKDNGGWSYLEDPEVIRICTECSKVTCDHGHCVWFTEKRKKIMEAKRNENKA